MRPTEVNDSMFEVHHVLYDNGEFSIIWGTWAKGDQCLGMRWNGDPTSAYPNGYPTGKGGRPIWLVIPTQLSIPFVTSLLGQDSANLTEVLEVIRTALDRQDAT